MRSPFFRGQCRHFRSLPSWALATRACPAQDKDESGFASIDELDPKSAKVRRYCRYCGCEELPKYMGVSINGGTPKWMVYKGKSN